MPSLSKESQAQAEKQRAQEELLAAQEKARLLEASKAELEAELVIVRQDRGKLKAALVEAGQNLQGTQQRIDAVQERLEQLKAQDVSLRKSLESRKDLMSEVLAALQRMGRHPPPAVLVKPGDVLEAVRSSLLLGAVVPQLRSEVEALAMDLETLRQLGEELRSEQNRLVLEQDRLKAETLRLDALMEARQQRISQSEGRLQNDKEQMARLSLQAKSLKDLMDRMEREIETIRLNALKAEEEAKKAQELKEKTLREQVAQAFNASPSRLAPKQAFAQMRGQILLPVVGQKLRGFDEPDGFGGVGKGITLVTRPKAPVLAPSDGWVVFAGPFRSYGRLLIINAGGGYYLLMAGMEKLSVELGQFVLAGEPVAVMGERVSPSAILGAIDRDDPVLYVEFRKDGSSFDPAPWWTKSLSEKVRG